MQNYAKYCEVITPSDARRTPESQRLLVLYEKRDKLVAFRFIVRRIYRKDHHKQRRFKRALRDKLTLRTSVWGQRNLAAFGRVNTSPDWKSTSRVSSFPSLFDPSSLD